MPVIRGPEDTKGTKGSTNEFLPRFVHSKKASASSALLRSIAATPDVLMFRSETSIVEKSLESAILIMRAMKNELDELKKADPNIGNKETDQLTSQIQEIESGLETFRNAIKEIDKGDRSRAPLKPELIAEKMAEISKTFARLKDLNVIQSEQNIEDTSPAGQYKILNNMLVEAIAIGNKYLTKLTDKQADKQEAKVKRNPSGPSRPSAT